MQIGYIYILYNLLSAFAIVDVNFNLLWVQWFDNCVSLASSIHFQMVYVPWLRGRASDSRLRGPGFESCAAVIKHWASVVTLHYSSPLSCINEYLAIDKW